MRRLLTSPRWWLLHLVTVVMIVAFVLLGRWQWHRFHATDSLQYLSYAVQWPLFAAFVVFFHWRIVRTALHPPTEAERRSAAPTRRREPAPMPVPAGTDDEEPDEALTEYNRYLACLDAQDRAEQHRAPPHGAKRR